LSEIIHQYDFTNVIHEPTRVCSTRQSLLDPVLISSTCTCPEASVISIHREISGHNATLAHINIPISISGIFKRQFWLYKQADFILLNELISNTDWTGLFENCTTVDDAC